MSYILDALRKTERERQQAEPLILHSIGAEAVELPRRRLGFVAGGTVVLLATAFGAYWWMFVGGRAPPVPALAAPASTPRESPSMNTVAVTTTDKQPDTASKVVRRAPEFKRSPFVPPHRAVAIRDLANEARIEQSSPPPKMDAAAASTSPATAKAEAPAAPAETSSPPEDSIKFLRAMPPEFRRGLPDLAVTIHIYAPRPADRILYINNRQYRVGERVGDGVVVKEIVPDGVVLSYHGQLFKLPRPT